MTDPEVVVALERGRCGFFSLTILEVPEHPLAEEGEGVEDEAAADNEADHHDPVLPAHGDDAQCCDLNEGKQNCKNYSLGLMYSDLVLASAAPTATY